MSIIMWAQIWIFRSNYNRKHPKLSKAWINWPNFVATAINSSRTSKTWKLLASYHVLQYFGFFVHIPYLFDIFRFYLLLFFPYSRWQTRLLFCIYARLCNVCSGRRYMKISFFSNSQICSTILFRSWTVAWRRWKKEDGHLSLSWSSNQNIFRKIWWARTQAPTS